MISVQGAALGSLVRKLKKEREIAAALRAEVAKLKQHHHQAETEQAVRMARPLKYPRQHSA